MIVAGMIMAVIVVVVWPRWLLRHRLGRGRPFTAAAEPTPGHQKRFSSLSM